MLTSLLVGLIAFRLTTTNVFADPDIWWHLRDARLLVETHSFIHSETYSFTANGRPWINSEWLSEVPFYAAWRWFGPRGIFLLTTILIEAVTLGVVALCVQRSRNIKAALIAGCLFLPMISVSMGPRTVMFGWLCLIVEIFLLREFREGRDRLWLLPVLFALWINLHGTWPIGLVYLLLFLAGGLTPQSWGSPLGSIITEHWSKAQRARLVVISALAFLALFLNPYGAHLVAFPVHMLFGHRLMIDSVAEWQTLDFHGFRGKFTFLLIAVLFLTKIVRKRAWRLDELAFALIAILGAFTYSRLLVLAGIVLCSEIAAEFDFLDPYNSNKEKPLLNLAVLALLARMLFIHLPNSQEFQQQIAVSCPLRALEYLQSINPKGSVLNDLSWGGFIEWNDPNLPVFIDSRSEIYDTWGVLRDYIDVQTIQRPFELLDQHHIRYVLFPRNERLPYVLAHTPGWTVRYQDETAVLFERYVAQ